MKRALYAAALIVALLLLALPAGAEGDRTLTLPAHMTVIEREAFRGLQNVDRIVLPSGVTEIGPLAFAYSSVGEIYVPSTVVRIADDALQGSPDARFVSDDALWCGVFKYAVDGDHIVIKKYMGSSTAVTIPSVIDGKSVTHIGRGAFSGRQDILRVTIPSSVTSIGEDAFYDCYAMTQADIPSGVTEIGYRAFCHCRELLRADIPSGVTALSNQAFYDCRSLATVTLPDGLQSIGEYTFGECWTLGSINFPSGLTTIASSAFNNAARDVTGNPIYRLPESVTAVGDYVFHNCGAALCVTRGGSVETLLRETGYTLTYYDRLDYRYQYKKIDDVWSLYLTRYVGAGGSVNIPAGPAVIGEDAFRENTVLTSVTIPSGVTLIDRNAFYGCGGLTTVNMPDSLTTVGVNAFYRCAALTNVRFSANLLKIDSDAFDYACTVTGTHYYVLPDGVQTLGWSPFSDCGAVLCFNRDSDTAMLFKQNQYIYTYTGETDFRYRWYSGEGTEGHEERLVQYTGTTNTSVTIPAYIWLIDNEAFRDHTELTSVVIPEGVTQIKWSAFRDCTHLTSISLPDSLTQVNDYVFAGCGSASMGTFILDLPSGIAGVGPGAFDSDRMILRCDKLSTTASVISVRGYSFVRADRPDETDIRYRYGYFDNNNWRWALYDYVGGASSVRLPDDCEKAYRGILSQKVADGLELVCGQTSDTARGLSQAETNFTFPGHEGLRYRIIEGVLYVMGYEGSPTTITIPRAAAWIAAGYDERIRGSAFRGRENLTKVVIAEGVTRIDSDAFTDCYNLTDITFPSTLKSIDQNAFRWCGQNVTEPFYFILPDNMEDIAGRGGGATTFSDVNAVLVCGKTSQTAALLTDRNYVYTCPGEYDYRYRYVAYTEGETTGRRLWLVGYVGTGATATIPEGIYGIRLFDYHTDSSYWRTFYGDGFYGNETVTKVVIPEGTVVIEDSAFRGCLNLTDITFPSTLKVLENHAFEQCGKNVTTKHYFVLPDDMEEISTNVDAGWGAFTDIGSGRISCAAGSETARLVSNAYTGHYNGYYHFALKGHEGDGLLYRYQRYETDVSGEYDYRLVLRVYEGAGASVTIPENQGLYRIENGVFSGHSEIRALSIPDGVVEIGQDAFSGCSLWHGTDDENVIGLPNSIKVIGSRAFMDVGAAYTAERFYMVLPNSLDSFDISAVHGCNAVFVAPGGLAQRELYLNWYRYYLTLEDAINRRNLQARDSEDLEQVYYGRA